jgi:hypothetical protein
MGTQWSHLWLFHPMISSPGLRRSMCSNTRHLSIVMIQTRQRSLSQRETVAIRPHPSNSVAVLGNVNIRHGSFKHWRIIRQCARGANPAKSPNLRKRHGSVRFLDASPKVPLQNRNRRDHLQVSINGVKIELWNMFLWVRLKSEELMYGKAVGNKE